jgi:hypothetical protein
MAGGALALQLAGSELAGIDAQDDLLRLRFAAAAVTRDGEPGHLAPLVLDLHGARWRGEPAQCFGAVREAVLAADGRRWREVPLPCDLTGALVLELACHAGALRVEATRLVVAPAADARWKPSYAC